MNSNSVGEFREGEIDGKPYFIYTLLSQKDISSSSDLPLFLCPFLRSNVKNLKPYDEEVDADHSFPLVVSPQFPSGHPQPEYLLQSNSCKLPLLPLFWCNNKQTSDSEFICPACVSDDQHGTSYYFCVTCGDIFHKECVGSPLELKHPSLPSLSLQLYSHPVSFSSTDLRCFCCQMLIFGMSYYCPSYNLFLHLICAFKPIPIVIDHLKRHPHPLTFFPKQASLACDVCSVINELFPTYVCLRCIYVVHQDCIYFPYVIKISRHHHRISFTSSLPSGKWSCGVCRQKIDNDCGAYSCNKCDDYFVHSRCAVRRDLWDGEELEGVPEEPELVVEPFERIADGIILHFSHVHHLQLETSTQVYDGNKLCQGCVFPIYEGSYYSCMDNCDFILHEACANAPCKKHHALNAYPLTLKVVTDEYDKGRGHFICDACKRQSCGFIYENRKSWGFRLDLRCASVSEPFGYEGHEHPLFLALKPEEEKSAECHICQQSKEKSSYCRKLNCIECDFVICFKCATLPYKARYQHDKHFLTFYQAKEANDHSEWCDVCERKIADSRKKGFYSCDDCCTTLHIDCLLGESMYLKPGHTVKYIAKSSYYLHIVRNNTLSRPYCCGCGQRCPHKVVFQESNLAYCDVSCYERQLINK
ncbi:Protein VACUOLELESS GAMETOPHYTES [Cardamine amara subsp. amara]|uniref:Protein VACUOLELESS GAMETOPHYTES n=1 Tax=Cardamine amara subsp. amara TaxID=228776 RepID=A0ABD1B9V6_CARAN